MMKTSASPSNTAQLVVLRYLEWGGVKMHFGLPDLLGPLVPGVDHDLHFALSGQAEVARGGDHAGLAHPKT